MTEAPPPLSIKIGGRLVSPALSIVSSSPPTPLELSFSSLLRTYSDHHVPVESSSEIRLRERVLKQMEHLCRSWIKSVCIKGMLPPDVVENAGGQLFTSGSYRLGVHEPGADIDTILVAPNVCTREDFFGSGYVPPDYDGESDLGGVRDPNSLAERIRNCGKVSNFVAVEGAAVPILTFDWEGVNIDLLFARLNSSSVPENFDIDDDGVLDGVDPATEKSLNGPRVTNLIATLVSGNLEGKNPERYERFLKVVRCVRKWAKNRGLYSNKMGYWGGVNINIAVALVVQLYPNACPSSLLRKFFLLFKIWRWPDPILLTKPHDANLGLRVWNAHHVNNLREVAPIVTPAYPAMNSTASVSRGTLRVMVEEFSRANDILDRLWKDHREDPTKGDWEVFGELFEPSDFYINYSHYLSLCIVGPSMKDAQSWAGYVESRLRKLVSDLLGKSLPLSKIQLFPKKLEACVADRSALLTVAQRKNSITYFVGFNIDRFRMRGNELNVELQLQKFRERDLSRFEPFVQGMDFLVKDFEVKELPLICFEGVYEGGKVAAMQKRRRIRDADPKRIEAKKKAKLKELNAQIQKNKEKIALATALRKKKERGGDGNDEVSNDRKRKREGEGDDDDDDNHDDDPDEKNPDGIKTEMEEKVKLEADETQTSAENLSKGEKEEEALLENALDNIQKEAGEGGGKTREEAERDRKKLVAGELLVENVDIDESDDEEGPGYGPEGARKAALNAPENDINTMNIAEREAEILRRSGYSVVSDDEKITIGGNMIHPWRRERIEKKDTKISKKRGKTSICFKTKFDVVELDPNGFVVDKGDGDFKPSRSWTGRQPGFEFKLGERGLGYYRTGKKVIVPSNTAY